VLNIKIPKSHTAARKKSTKADWQRQPTLQSDEDDKVLEHFMQILYSVVKHNAANKTHIDGAEKCLDALVLWRNTVYNRLTEKFPTKAQLHTKYLAVAEAALDMHEQFRLAFGKVTPCIHACLHNGDYLENDLVDRTGEALEHLNKIMKQLSKLTARRSTSTATAKPGEIGHHKAGTGTCKTAHILSLVCQQTKQALTLEQRKKLKAGLKNKVIIAIKPEPEQAAGV
jgi:hypothetical protein